MKLSLAFACVLSLVAGCKTDSNAPSASQTAPEASGSATARAPGRSGRIDMPRVRPRLDDGASTDPNANPTSSADFGERRRERMKEWDADGDGQLSDTERAAMRQQRLEGMHARFDHDGDGKLTPEELSTTRWFHGDASTADANKDGDISTDELQQALEQVRGNRRRPQFGGERKLP